MLPALFLAVAETNKYFYKEKTEKKKASQKGGVGESQKETE